MEKKGAVEEQKEAALEAARIETRARELEESRLRDMCAVLDMPEGRRVLWFLLEHTKVFESIWVGSAQIHANAGRQDVGHFLMARIDKANPEALFTMMREARNSKPKGDQDVR